MMARVRVSAGAERWFRAVLGAACLLAALYYVGSTAGSIWHYGWTELFQDQFRQYTNLLAGSFPSNIWMPDNSHRQITSNLIRLGDLHLRHGDQDMGVLAGLIMLCGLFLALARCWLVDREQPRLFRSTAVLLTAVALMWLGSARMQFHGNEAFQIYLVMTCALVVIFCVESLRRNLRPAMALLALAAAGTALVSFASGVAVSGLLIALLLLRGIPWRWTVVLAGIALFAVFAYMFLLPGGDGVRNTISTDFVDVARNTVTFLSSSWTTGWLSYAHEGIGGFDAERMSTMRFGTALVESARVVFMLSGEPSLLGLAFAIGLCGLALLGWRLWHAWRWPEQVGASEVVGLGLALFALGVATLVALGRSRMFEEFPGQVLADRYVPWSNLFWLGVAVAVGARVARPRFGAPIFAASALLVAIMLYPSNRAMYGWASAVEHEIERRAAQIQAGVEAEGLPKFADMPDLVATRAAIASLRQHRVAMFRAERNHLLGLPVALPPEQPTRRAEVGRTAPVHEISPYDQPAWHVQGRLLDVELREQIDGLVVVDSTGRVVGLGEFSFRTIGGGWQRMDDMADGFDVYLRATPPCSNLRLFGADDDARHFVELSPLHECSLAQETP